MAEQLDNLSFWNGPIRVEHRRNRVPYGFRKDIF